MGYRKITSETLKKWRACKDNYNVFNELFPNGATLKTASKKLIDTGYKEYSDWLWLNCSNDAKYIKQTVITLGSWGEATVGCRGMATTGLYGMAIAGKRGMATAGYKGKAIAGDYGIATAGQYGTATVGNEGTATVGNEGTATAGDNGTATAGNWGIAIAGDFGTIQIKYYFKDRYRIKTGYIGEDGLKANTPYKLDDNNNFKEVK